MNNTSPLDFRDLLDLLGHGESGDHTSICWQRPGGEFKFAVVPSAKAVDRVARLPDRVDVWFGVNPLTHPSQFVNPKSRGAEPDVRRLAAVYCDLDVKPGGLADDDAVIETSRKIAEHLGRMPAAIVQSGSPGGRHLYWPIADELSGVEAKALLVRFGRLVQRCAEEVGGSVDNVFELARILRVPGTFNHKTATPQQVKGWAL